MINRIDVQNDPINWVDPEGLKVTNNSGNPWIVQPEDNSTPGIIPPGYEWPGSPDGVCPEDGGEWKKVRGKPYLPDNDVTIDPNGDVRCTGGPCKWVPGMGPTNRPRDLWPIPKNPKNLPDIRPIPK